MEAINNEELVEAFIKSNKTLEEAIAFFKSDTKVEVEKPKQERRQSRRKKQAGTR